MANASKTHMSPGSQGKGSGTGAMTELPEGILEENMVLSNRDKAQHTQERGLDSKTVQTEQYHDHAANRRNFDQTLGGPQLSNGSGLASPMSDDSADLSSIKTRSDD